MGLSSSEEIAFFGKVNASISHKLNNILATISETAGLLGDLVEMTEKGGTLELGTLRMCCDTIVEEIHRGFDIVKNMNRFAHSGDVPVKETEITEIITLVSTLSSYLSYAKPLRLDFSAVAGVKIVTRLLYLEKLLYITLDTTFKSLEIGDEVIMSAQSEDSGVKILLSIPGAPENITLLSDEAKDIAGVLNADMTYQPSDKIFAVLLPHSIE